MSLTLQKIRQTFINTYQEGFDTEDRSLQNAFINELAFQARASIVLATPIFDHQWLQKITVSLTKVVEQGGFYYTASVPTINETREGAGVYMIKCMLNNINTEIPVEPVSLVKFMHSKYDRYTNKKAKVAMSGNTIYIKTAPNISLPSQVSLIAVLYDPFDDITFNDVSPFPFSPGYLTNLIEVMFNTYLIKMSGPKENENNSSETIRPFPQQTQRQQQGEEE